MQLIDATTDEHIWANDYDRDLTDVFMIQSDLAQKIAGELQAKLSPTEKVQMTQRPTENGEAYLAYIQAMNLRVPEDTEKLKQAEQLFQRALELGINFLDTADIYGPYTNEELVGRAIKGKRDKVVLATKFGIVRDPKTPNLRAVNGKPDYVRQSCEGSLRRLGVETIDLYYQHRVDPNTPIEETVGAMAELVMAAALPAAYVTP